LLDLIKSSPLIEFLDRKFLYILDEASLPVGQGKEVSPEDVLL